VTSWILDLDGVVWRGSEPVPGSVEAISRLQADGHLVGYCTNNSSKTVSSYHHKLNSMGIETPDIGGNSPIVTSAQAAAQLLSPGDRVLLCAGEGAAEAVTQRGCTICDQGAVDVVLVGYDDRFSYSRLAVATTAVLGGARLVATNNDPLYPTEFGPAPGAGSLLAAVEYASGAQAEIAGKPFAPMASLVLQRFGDLGVFIGDSLATDGELAKELGWQFGLVLSGNTSEAQAESLVDQEWVGENLAALVQRHGGHRPAARS
jgi:HAD superfamily hydrolase (TIGR01450 family)